ncbi:MAG: F0F1 ATP synthase subunit A [Bacteroidales bacterium]
MTRTKNIFCYIFLIATLLLPTSKAFAGGGDTGELDVSEYIMSHTSDSYSWHIADYKDKHYSIPLPIILYSTKSGFHCFLSSKFWHGHSYKGFKIAESGAYKGKIVEIDETGAHLEEHPIDLSMKRSIIGMIFSCLLIIGMFVSFGKRSGKYIDTAPKGAYAFFEPLILFVRDQIAKPSIGEQKYQKFLPLLLTLFMFIIINNILGLIPIFPFGANVTGTISITMALALVAMFAINFYASKNYWKHTFNPEVPMFMKFPIPIMQCIELIGLILKPAVLMIRLFANIMAGHLVISAFIVLIFIFTNMFGPTVGAGVSVFSVIFGTVMTFLEILVAVIQAYIFTILTAIFIGLAVEENH